jgi:hypothetical protein
MPTDRALTEADILEEIIAPFSAHLSPELASVLLRLKFDGAATRKIRNLLQQNNRGNITAEDRILLERYLRVGRMLDLIQAKARLALTNGSREMPRR